MGRIAVVDHSMQLHLTDVDGKEGASLDAPGSGQTWPVWAPDGKSLVFSTVSSGSNGHGHIELYLTRFDGNPPTILYKNERGTDAIARGTPHYALWSPDGRRVAFIAQTSDGSLSLFVRSPGDQSEPRRLVGGRPLFFAWSFDARHLLAHCGPNHYIVDTRDEMAVTQMPAASTLYSAPSWSPVDSQMALMRQTGQERQALMAADTTSGSTRMLTEFTGGGVFSWAPRGRSIALAHGLDPESRFYPGLWILEYDGEGQRRVTEDPLVCFYWSPDGTRLAYLTTSEESEGWSRWAVLNVDDGSCRYFGDFVPTEEQLNMVLFFDQYSLSHNPWSPDGKMLLYAGTDASSVDLLVPDEASVFVQDVVRGGAPRALASGSMGAWAPG